MEYNVFAVIWTTMVAQIVKFDHFFSPRVQALGDCLKRDVETARNGAVADGAIISCFPQVKVATPLLSGVGHMWTCAAHNVETAGVSTYDAKA
jgi:hypothetical protein